MKIQNNYPTNLINFFPSKEISINKKATVIIIGIGIIISSALIVTKASFTAAPIIGITMVAAGLIIIKIVVNSLFMEKDKPDNEPNWEKEYESFWGDNCSKTYAKSDLKKICSEDNFLFTRFFKDPHFKKPSEEEADNIAFHYENWFGVFWFKDGTRFANNNGDVITKDDWKERVNEIRSKFDNLPILH